MLTLSSNRSTPVQNLCNSLIDLAVGIVERNLRERKLPEFLRHHLSMATIDPKRDLGSDDLNSKLREFHKAVLQVEHGDLDQDQVFSDQKIFQLIEEGNVLALREVMKYQEFGPEHFVKAITSDHLGLIEPFFDKRKFAFGLNSKFDVNSKNMVTVLPYSFDRLYGSKFVRTDLFRVALDYLEPEALDFLLTKSKNQLGLYLGKQEFNTIPFRLVAGLYENRLRGYLRAGNKLSEEFLTSLADRFVAVLKILQKNGFDISHKDAKSKTVMDYLESHKGAFVGYADNLHYLSKLIIRKAQEAGLNLTVQ